MLRRLLERFEQGIESRCGKHVDFVDDINLKPGTGRRIFAGLAQLTHLLDSVIAGAIDFQDVKRTPFGNFPASSVRIIELDFWTVGAVETLGENPRNGGLAGAARPAEEVSVGDSFLLD